MNYLHAVTLFSSIIIASFFSGSALSTGITKCVHPDGRTEFSDKPCPTSSESSTVRPLQSTGRTVENAQTGPLQNNEANPRRRAKDTSRRLSEDTHSRLTQETHRLRIDAPSAPSSVSNQAKSAYAAWHQSLVSNDFVAFKKMHSWFGRVGMTGGVRTEADHRASDAELKVTFDAWVKNVPQPFKLSESKPPTDRAAFLVVVGCKNNVRVTGYARISKVVSIVNSKVDDRWWVDPTELMPYRVEAEPADLPCPYEGGPAPEKAAPESKAVKLINGLTAEDRLKSCNPSVALAAAAEIVGHPASLKEPIGLFSSGMAFFLNGKKDEGVFWFYAAQLRVRQQMVLENGDRGQILSVMLMTAGPLINNYAFQDTSNLNRILDRVLEWDKKTENPFREKARARNLEKQMDQVYVGFNELKSKISIEKTSMEAAAREASPRIEQVIAQMNNDRCRAGQPDPAYENQAKKLEGQQALDYITLNEQMIKLVGGPVKASLSSSTNYSHDRNRGRYNFGIASQKRFFAIVDVDRSSGKPEFKLACVTTLSMGERQAGKDDCLQSTIPLPK